MNLQVLLLVRSLRTFDRYVSLLCLISALSFVLSGHSHAAEPAVDCKHVDKIGSTYDLAVCAGRANVTARQNLEVMVRRLRSAIPDESGKKLLDQSQASWWAWKKKEAQLCADSYGYDSRGSGYEQQLDNCAASLIIQRTKTLKQFLDLYQSR